MVRNCTTCRIHANDVAEPLLPTEFPTRPWEHVGSDLFYCKQRWYLLLVDYYSGYIEVSLIAALSPCDVIEHMKSHFARHGIPELLTSDNGPQYASEEFRKFAGAYSFQHVTSSPRYQQSTGAAERAVQTIKSIMKKVGIKLRSTVPTHPNVLKPKLPNAVHIRQKEVELKTSSKFNFDRKHRSKELPPLTVGDEILIKKRPAKVVDANPGTPRSYVVDSDSSTVRRNRRALRELSQSSIPHPQPACLQLEHTGVNMSRYGRTIKAIKRLDL